MNGYSLDAILYCAYFDGCSQPQVSEGRTGVSSTLPRIQIRDEVRQVAWRKLRPGDLLLLHALLHGRTVLPEHRHHAHRRKWTRAAIDLRGAARSAAVTRGAFLRFEHVLAARRVALGRKELARPHVAQDLAHFGGGDGTRRRGGVLRHERRVVPHRGGDIRQRAVPDQVLKSTLIHVAVGA